MISELSILIPIYNFNVRHLVESILMQCESIPTLSFEIILIDDYSSGETKFINETLIQKLNVFYTELQQNIGRSKIRNLLASKAKYSHLLFLDCDSGIVYKDFISNYLATNNKVVYGGTKYQSIRPDNKYFLHWSYGKTYEALDKNKRQLNPYLSFKTNNFLIEKEVFTSVRFDENIKEYGHEDTLFAMELKRKSMSIIHIHNPVYHLGLDINRDFIVKVEKSVSNLLILAQKHNFSIKLLKLAKVCNFFPINSILRKLTIPLRAIILKYPNARLLQLYKLCMVLDA
jgi:glycosyltransferase involved in cell wall biosynthesis